MVSARSSFGNGGDFDLAHLVDWTLELYRYSTPKTINPRHRELREPGQTGTNHCTREKDWRLVLSWLLCEKDSFSHLHTLICYSHSLFLFMVKSNRLSPLLIGRPLQTHVFFPTFFLVLKSNFWWLNHAKSRINSCVFASSGARQQKVVTCPRDGSDGKAMVMGMTPKNGGVVVPRHLELGYIPHIMTYNWI